MFAWSRLRSVWRISWSILKEILRYTFTCKITYRRCDVYVIYMEQKARGQVLELNLNPVGHQMYVTYVMSGRAPLTETLRLDRTYLIQKALTKSSRIASIWVLLSIAVIQLCTISIS